MEQLREIKKAIKNKYKENFIQTDVDEAGFVIVKATFKEFGQILFANQTLSNWLSYDDDYLVSKQIGCLMPTIIGESHPKFWKRFNQYGVPSFIERDQHLLIKNSEGYLLPMQAYIKFYHDKTYGHTFTAIFNKAKVVTPFKNQR